MIPISLPSTEFFVFLSFPSSRAWHCWDGWRCWLPAAAQGSGSGAALAARRRAAGAGRLVRLLCLHPVCVLDRGPRIRPPGGGAARDAGAAADAGRRGYARGRAPRAGEGRPARTLHRGDVRGAGSGIRHAGHAYRALPAHRVRPGNLRGTRRASAHAVPLGRGRAGCGGLALRHHGKGRIQGREKTPVPSSNPARWAGNRAERSHAGRRRGPGEKGRDLHERARGAAELVRERRFARAPGGVRDVARASRAAPGRRASFAGRGERGAGLPAAAGARSLSRGHAGPVHCLSAEPAPAGRLECSPRTMA